MKNNLYYLPHQKDAIRFVEEHNGYAIIGDDCGCIDGEAIITIYRNKVTKKMSIAKQYKYFHSKRANKNSDTITYIRGLKDGRFKQLPIKNILYKGIKSVIEIQTLSGKKLKLTEDHLLLNDKYEWIEAKDVQKNDKIIVNGKNVCKRCGSDKELITYKQAKFIGYCKKCMRTFLKDQWIYEDDKRIGTDGYVYLFGKKYAGQINNKYGGILEHRYLMEQKIGRKLFAYEEIHHINGIRNDNRLKNLKLVTESEHKKIHKTENHFGNFIHKSGSEIITIPKEDTIVSIKKRKNKIAVYDIVVNDECHNFVANGIVVHNCGKTMEAIGISDLIYPGKYIIICTKSMKLKWAREIHLWTGKDSYIISGEKTFNLPKNYDYYIINYHILGRENAKLRKEELAKKKKALENNLTYKMKPVPVEGWWKELVELSPIGIFPDEAHRLGNPKAIWTRSVIELFKQTKPKVFVPLSGTITRKKPKSLFTNLHLVAPNLFPNEYRFYYRFCDPKHTRWGWTFDGATHIEELHDLMSKVMIRRLKEDVFKDLPSKIISCIPMELSKLEESNYLSANESLIQIIKSTKNKLEKNNGLARLKQIAYLAKRNSLFDWIDDFIEDHDKLILGCWHKSVIEDLIKRYDKIAVKIDGSVTDEKRLEAEDRFQTDPKVKIIILQIDAGGEGLTLTASDSVGIIEIPDTPGQLIQFCDRAHRKGQTRQVTVYFPFANGTIENIVADRLEESFKAISMILDGKKDTTLFNYSFDEVIMKNLK